MLKKTIGIIIVISLLTMLSLAFADDFSTSYSGGGIESSVTGTTDKLPLSLPYKTQIKIKVDNTTSGPDGNYYAIKPSIKFHGLSPEVNGTNKYFEIYKGATKTFEATVPYGDYNIIITYRNNASYGIEVTGTYLPTIKPATLTLNKGATHHLSVFCADGLSQSWTSSDEGIAVVQDGMVTAKNTGEARIKCQFGDGTESYVDISVASVEMDKTEENVHIGQQCQLKLNGASGNILWSSSNDEIATVNQDGLVTGMRAGEATITAAFMDNTYTCQVSVLDDLVGDVQSVLGKGKERVNTQLPDKFRDFATNAYTNDYILLETDDNNDVISVALLTDAQAGIGKYTLFGLYPGMKYSTAVATVGNYGWGVQKTVDEWVYFINSLMPQKKLYVTVVGDKIDMIILTGWDAEASSYDQINLTLNATEKTCITDGVSLFPSFQLQATLTPNLPGYQALHWDSSNTSVATVNENGVVHCRKIGTCVITVTSAVNPDIKATCTVHVKGTDQIKGFVSRCYRLILNREADEGGLNNWTALLASGNANASEIISCFLYSEEYQNLNNTDDATVEILYNTMLDRGSDPAGKDNWMSYLSAGCSDLSIINGFCGSQEFGNICTDYGITPGSVAPEQRDRNRSVTAFVSRCYWQALNRSGDAGGLNYWCQMLLDKVQTPKEVASGFVFSQEMTNQNLSNEALVDRMYQLYLGREADPEGREYWVRQLENGMTLEELNNGFADSVEFQDITAGYGL